MYIFTYISHLLSWERDSGLLASPSISSVSPIQSFSWGDAGMFQVPSQVRSSAVTTVGCSNPDDRTKPIFILDSE